MSKPITKLSNIYDIPESTIESLIPDKRIRGSDLQSQCEKKEVPLSVVFLIMIKRGWYAGTTEDGEDIYWPPESVHD